jgi:hypothetical protein
MLIYKSKVNCDYDKIRRITLQQKHNKNINIFEKL